MLIWLQVIRKSKLELWYLWFCKPGISHGVAQQFVLPPPSFSQLSSPHTRLFIHVASELQPPSPSPQGESKVQQFGLNLGLMIAPGVQFLLPLSSHELICLGKGAIFVVSTVVAMYKKCITPRLKIRINWNRHKSNHQWNTFPSILGLLWIIQFPYCCRCSCCYIIRFTNTARLSTSPLNKSPFAEYGGVFYFLAYVVKPFRVKAFFGWIWQI